jgi:hypothetical protein
MPYYNVKDSYESEIEFNDILGDIGIYDMSDLFSEDFKYARKDLMNGYISRLEYDIYTEMMSEFLDEYVQLRINEFNKWFNFNY